MKLSNEDDIINNHICLMNYYYAHVDLIDFAIMPDHIHLLIVITDNEFEYPENFDVVVNPVYTIHQLYIRGLQQSKSFFKNHGYLENPTKQQMENFKKIKT